MAYKTLAAAAACIAGVAGQSFVINDATYSHEWMSKTAMPVKRSDMTATTVGDGIYIIGGCTNDQEYSTGAQRWADLTEKVWKKKLMSSTPLKTNSKSP